MLQFLEKLSSFGQQHQAAVGIVIAFSVICVSWGIEKILEKYVFKKQRFFDYALVIVLGLFLLWLTYHYVLHII